MTHRDRLTQLIAAGALVACLVLSGGLSTALSAEAGRSQLVYADTAGEEDSSAVALGIALGAFRGLFVNYLWLRANDLKQDGKFHEAIELSSAITKLQPRFPRVWAFHAWNMAYNISVATKTAEERWEWVKAGINLLRSEAIPMNPNDVLLHKELAWIFVHKVQGYADDANRYYKRKLAEEWEIVLGTPPALPEDYDAAVEAMAEWFRPIVDAPQTLEGVVQREMDDRFPTDDGAEQPPAEEASGVARLVRAIRDEAGLDLDRQLLRLVAYHRAYRGAWYSEGELIRLAETDRNQRLAELLEDPELADAWDRLLPHVRKRLIIDEYHMSPRTMLDHIRKYGPLDYRHPAAHSLYWAVLGVEEGLQRESTTFDNTINTDRIVVHSLQELFRTGEIIFDLVTGEYITLQSFHFTHQYLELVVNELKPRGGVAEQEWRVFTLYGQGLGNFVKDVIRAYYRVGNIEAASFWYREYLTGDWRNLNDPTEWEAQENETLDQFVKRQLIEDERFSIPYVATSEVHSALTDGFVRGLLRDDREVFRSQWEYARLVHEIYFSHQNVGNIVDRDQQRMEYMPRNFVDAAAVVLYNLIIAGSTDPGAADQLGVVQASQVYKKTPIALRRAIFDPLARHMAQRGMSQQVFADLFPEPDGMEAYREAKRQEELQGREGRKKRLQIEQQ